VVTADYYFEMQAFIVVPALIIGVLWLVVYLPAYLGSVRTNEEERHIRRKSARKKLWKLIYFVLFLVYPMVSAMVLRFFVCENIQGTDYLVADFTLHCYTDDWFVSE
jgi:accessory gene regulator protein AgrB